MVAASSFLLFSQHGEGGERESKAVVVGEANMRKTNPFLASSLI